MWIWKIKLVSHFENDKRLVENLKIQNKKIIYYFLIYTISASIYPFFAVVLPRLLIGELTIGDAARVEYLIFVIVGYLLFAGIFGFTKTYMKDYAYPKLSKLSIDYIRDMFDKLVTWITNIQRMLISSRKMEEH